MSFGGTGELVVARAVVEAAGIFMVLTRANGRRWAGLKRANRPPQFRDFDFVLAGSSADDQFPVLG